MTATKRDLGHVVSEWREHGREVKTCAVCGGRWENAAILRECAGGPPQGTVVRSVRCRHCKVEPVTFRVKDGEAGGRSVTWLTNSETCRACGERVCGGCPVSCPVTKR